MNIARSELRFPMPRRASATPALEMIREGDDERGMEYETASSNNNRDGNGAVWRLIVVYSGITTIAAPRLRL